jgi:hypothetical protein
MLLYPIRQRTMTGPHAFGGALGQQHLKPLLDELGTGIAGSGQVVVLDFEGIEAVTASYLKATIIYLFKAGRAAAEGAEARNTTLPAPMNIFPAVANLRGDVPEELDEVLSSIGQRLPCLEATLWDAADERIRHARLRGYLDTALRETIEFLNGRTQPTTAQALAADNSTVGIKETGWNNRLADLHRLRLARRVKSGRHWLYELVAQEVSLG